MKPKKIIINLLDIFSWLTEIFIIYKAAFSIGNLGQLIFSSGYRANFFNQEEMRLTSHTLTMVILNAIGEFLVAIAICVLLHYGRKLILNIKHDLFFNIQNLTIIRKLLISFSVYTVLQVATNYLANSPYETSFSHLFSTSSNLPAIVSLGILYILYIIFKNGLALQDDVDKMI